LLRKYMNTRNRELLDQATVYGERAVQLDPDDPQAQITLGELRRVGGRFAEAATSFQRALALDSNSVDARLGLADTYDSMGYAAEADRFYREALALRPEYADVYGRYGRFCYQRGRFADAVWLFTRQTEILPDAPRAYANLGAALQASQRFSDAINAFQRSIEIQPTSAGYSNLARCEFYLGRYVEAAAAFEKATVLTPNNYVYWANLGDAYRWTPGQQTKAPAAFQRAIRLAREAIAVNPNDAAARSTVATCLAKSGSIAAANSELMLALKADPTSSGVLYQ